MNKVFSVLSLLALLFVHYDVVFSQEEEICQPVESLSVTTLSANSVSIQWYGVEDALGFEAIADTIGRIPQDCGTRYTTLNFEQIFYDLLPYETNEFLVRSLCYGEESDWRWLFFRYTDRIMTLPFSSSLTDNSITDSMDCLYSSDSNTFAYYYMDIEVGDTSVGNYVDFSFRSKLVGDTSKVSIFVLSPNSSISIDAFPEENYLLGRFGEGDTLWQRIHLELGTNISGSVQRLLFAWENNDGETTAIPVLIDSIDVASRYCAVVEDVTANEVSSTSAQISWNFAYNQNLFTLEYKPTYSDTWITVPNIESNYLLYDLQPDTYYDVRVKALCLYEESLFSSTLTFKTNMDLAVPTNITCTLTDSSAFVAWDEVDNATHYIIDWKENSTAATWNEQSTENNYILLTNLSENTEYVFRIKSAHEEITSLWAGLDTIKTRCSKNISFPYILNSDIVLTDSPENYDIAQCWLLDGQYVVSQVQDLTYLSSGELSFTYVSPVYFALEVSTDGGETYSVLDELQPTQTSVEKIYPLSSYIYYNDVVFRYAVNTFADENMQIRISNFRIDNGCPLPQNVVVENLTEDSFTLHWQDTNSVSQWLISLKDYTGNVIAQEYVTDTVYTSYNLTPATDYVLVLRSVCAGNPSLDSMDLNITTLDSEHGCVVPQDFEALWWHSDNGETLYATWEAQNGVNVWQVVYKDYYAFAWDTAIVTINPVFTLRNMELGHVFLVRVRAICNVGDTSDFTNELSVRIGENSLADEINKKNTVEVYPNPTRDKVFIKVNNEEIDRIILIDASGRTLKEYREATDTIDLFSFSKGVYYAIFYTKSNKKTVRKIILE